MQSRVTSHFYCENGFQEKRLKKVALESQFDKMTGYLRPTSSSNATSIVHDILDQVIEQCNEPQLIVQTIVNDLLHKIRTETESTTTKHAGLKVSDRTVRS